jgi:hypothetical protein
MDNATDLKKAIDTAGRYVWLDFTASPLSAIEEGAFYNCKKLTALTLPATVTRIENYAFDGCTGLTSVKFDCLITATNFCRKYPFPGNLRTAYLAGLAGTYTRANNAVLTWAKE